MQTSNPKAGFFGTIASAPFQIDAPVAFAMAVRQISMRTKGSPEGCRDYLDSTDGHHFARMVLGNIQIWTGAGQPISDAMITKAIREAITLSMRWSISHQMSREFGIRHGIPYLTGWVEHYTTQAAISNAAQAAHPNPGLGPDSMRITR